MVDETRERFMKEANELLATGVSKNNMNVNNKNLASIVSHGLLTKKLQMNQTKIPKIMQMDAIMNKIRTARRKADQRIQTETNEAIKKNALKKAARNGAAARNAKTKRNATFSSISKQVAQLKNQVGNNNNSNVINISSPNTLNALNARIAKAKKTN